jgi:hypothetical protein
MASASAPPTATFAGARVPSRPDAFSATPAGAVTDAAHPSSDTIPADLANTGEQRRSSLTTYPERTSHQSSQSSTFISGPSFLGLNSPGPASHSSSESGHYLLEDDEEPHSGRGKFILFAVALALAVGFGYLHFRQGGFDWLTSNKKPAPVSDVSQNAPQNETPQNNNDVLKTDAPNSGAAPNTNSGNSAAPPASDGTAPSNKATPAPSGAPTDTTQPTSAPNPPADSSSPGATPTSPTRETSADAGTKPADSTADSASDTPAETPAPAKSAVRARDRKPSPSKPAPTVERNDTVAEAERYIYGRGASQDCDHGVRLLKTTALQSNAKAMISLGALYSTGTCTPRDLPTAYRWFALALHRQPENQVLQDDLKSLWDKMTPPERQLAIKLSQ